MTTLKKHYFYRVFWAFFHFHFFLFCLFLFLQHEKRKNKKCNFLFENLILDIPPTIFWHDVTLFVFSKVPKKHYKNGEKQWKKNLDKFLTLDLDQYLTLEDQFLTLQYIYIYIHVPTS